MNGCRPIVEYMTFNLFVGIDQIINNAAKMRQMTGGQLMSIRFRGPTPG
jgi:pyruvate dehydrogenase E1 component beta subunit